MPTRKVDGVNNFWKALAVEPDLLKQTWQRVKTVMAPGALDALTKEMIYLAVSVANGCPYGINSHTATARKKGMSMDDQRTAYLLLALVWCTYCAVHSLLISPPVVQRVRERFPAGHRYHRIIFNIFSTLTLIPIVLYTLSMKAAPLFSWEGPLRGLQALMILTGLGLITAGARYYDFREFLGLTQIRKTDACQGIGADCELNTAGILGMVRHPWYTAVFFLLWARDLDPVAIVVNTVLSVYVIIGTHLEEKKLVTAYGPTYRDYQKKVSMFLPFKWFWSRCRWLF